MEPFINLSDHTVIILFCLLMGLKSHVLTSIDKLINNEELDAGSTFLVKLYFVLIWNYVLNGLFNISMNAIINIRNPVNIADLDTPANQTMINYTIIRFVVYSMMGASIWFILVPFSRKIIELKRKKK